MKKAIIVAINLASIASLDCLAVDEMTSLNVLVTEVASSCELPEPSFEERAKVSNRALYLSESGDHKQAIECYLALIKAGEWPPLVYEDLSISYSKTGMCKEAEIAMNNYIAWERRFWIQRADEIAATETDILEPRDWADFSKRRDIQTPYEEVHSFSLDLIKTELTKCKKTHDYQ